MSASASSLPKRGGERRMVSIRLSATARDILNSLSQEMGVSQAAVIELLLRKEAKRTGSP